jgi:hypothetical protein
MIEGYMIEILDEINQYESGTISITRHSVWLRMVMYDEFKKAVLSYFKVISQIEENHDKLKIACVLIEVRFR